MLASSSMRIALPEDAENIVHLEEELFPENCFNEYTIRNELKHGKCYVIDRDQKLIGYLLMRIDGDIVDIMRVGVSAGYQGSGLGSRMVEKALDEAPRAMLYVRKDNQGAIELYHHFKFKIVGEYEASWLMTTSS